MNISIEENKNENTDELEKVNRLLENAAASIDNGDFENAINSFEDVVEITQNIFGDNTELTEVKQKIKEIQDSLKKLRNV